MSRQIIKQIIFGKSSQASLPKLGAAFIELYCSPEKIQHDETWLAALLATHHRRIFSLQVYTVNVCVTRNVTSPAKDNTALPCFLTQFRCERGQIQVAVLVVMVVVSYCEKNRKRR